MADLEVDPDVLRAGKSKVFDVSDQVGDAGALVRTGEVPSAALGQVDGADVLARAVDEFVEVHGRDLEHGAVWINDAGDGLVRAAEEYERTDDQHADWLDQILEE